MKLLSECFYICVPCCVVIHLKSCCSLDFLIFDVHSLDCKTPSCKEERPWLYTLVFCCDSDIISDSRTALLQRMGSSSLVLLFSPQAELAGLHFLQSAIRRKVDQSLIWYLTANTHFRSIVLTCNSFAVTVLLCWKCDFVFDCICCLFIDCYSVPAIS